MRVSQEAYSIFLEREAAGREKIAALQQRLTAADERADVLEGLFRDMRKGDHAMISSFYQRIDAALKPAEGSTCNQIREESGLPVNTPCQACGHGACIDR
ncbi:hypothetical protein [Pseudomonas grimontii]|uniref:hypothetical protein n=1 Tax=Pseudomonas grimontii TaxID=129847 RepID=UPI0028E4AB09|nr:hypothetical protein [Pseudomonas grimontii]